MCGCGTWGHCSVVDLAVVGSWLDSMVLEGFSNLKDSMILSLKVFSYLDDSVI